MTTKQLNTTIDQALHFVLLTACFFLINADDTCLSQEQLIDVGGYKLQCREDGTGDPAVVFLNGGIAEMSYWDEVAGPISKITKVILYERAGHDKSEMGRIPRHGINVAEELNVLLKKLRVSKRYILLAHSAGCMYARIYASLYSEEVAALILLDPGDKDFLDTFGNKFLKGDEKQQWKDYWINTWARLAKREGGFGHEVQEKDNTIQQMLESRIPENLIYYVLSGLDRSNPDYFIKDYSKKVIEDFFDYQLDYHHSLIKDYPEGEIIIVEDSQHVIHQDRPDIVISTIKTVIESVKNSH
ncbi:alpha/beta fold hydrolase [candidate division KSB1 bacterium]